MRFVLNMLSIVVAGVLLYTGLIHAAQPYFFVHTLSSYRVLPAFANGVIGLWLPYFQVILAICIGLRLTGRVALCAAMALFFSFFAAQVSVLIRGFQIDCGCFGFVASLVSPTSAAVPAVLSCACVVLVAGRVGIKDSIPGQGEAEIARDRLHQ